MTAKKKYKMLKTKFLNFNLDLPEENEKYTVYSFGAFFCQHFIGSFC